jgi:hypothetical protein
MSECFAKNKEFSQHAAIARSQPQPMIGRPGVLHVCVMCRFKKSLEIF